MTSDEKEFLFLTHQIIDGKGFVDSNGDFSVRAPLFPALLALSLGGFGNSFTQLFIICCILGTLVVYLGYLLSLWIWNDRAAAVATACILGFYPGLVIYSALLQTETLYIVFFLAALLLALRVDENASTMAVIALGVVAGLATLTRAVFIGFFPILLGTMWVVRKVRGRNVLRPIMGAFAVFCLVLAPWTVRNAIIHKAFVPVSTVTGSSLLIGNNPFSRGTPQLPPEYEQWKRARAREHGVDSLEALPELQRSAVERDIAVEYMVSHPGRVAILAARKMFVFWVYPITQSATDHAIQGVAVGADIVLLSFAVIGFVAAYREKSRLAPIFVALMFFTLVQLVMHAEARYRLPLIPLLSVIGGLGIVAATDAGRRRELFATPSSRPILGLGISGILLVYGYTAWLFTHGAV